MGKTLRSLFDEIVVECNSCGNEGTCIENYVCAFREKVLRELKAVLINLLLQEYKNKTSLLE